MLVDTRLTSQPVHCDQQSAAYWSRVGGIWVDWGWYMCIVNHCFAGIVAVLVPSPKPYITLTKT